MDFPVKCSLFLRLTGTSLGQYGLYVVKTTGIEAETSAAELDDFAMRMGGEGDAAVLLEFIESAKLSFPTTAAVLSAWQKENSDFDLPEWFGHVVASENSATALDELDRVEAEYAEAIEAGSLALNRLKNEGAKPGDWLPVELERNRVFGIRAAIHDIRKMLPLRDSSARPERATASIPSLGGTKRNAHNAKVREQVVRAYREGGYVSKNAATAELAEKFNRSPSAVRKMLINI